MADGSPSSAPNGVALLTALGVGLGVVLLAAWLTATLSESETTSWVVTLGAGLVAAVATYFALARRGGSTVTKRPEQ